MLDFRIDIVFIKRVEIAVELLLIGADKARAEGIFANLERVACSKIDTACLDGCEVRLAGVEAAQATIGTASVEITEVEARIVGAIKAAIENVAGSDSCNSILNGDIPIVHCDGETGQEARGENSPTV
mgnify:CR=1 FL=1